MGIIYLMFSAKRQGIFVIGGVGSGRWCRGGGKTTTEEVHQVDIRYMQRQGLLRLPGYIGSLWWSCGGEQTGSINFRVERNCLVLMYRHQSYGEEWQKIKEQVWFDRTPCNYGGERLWFLCPNCSKRVAVLYCAGIRFLCRHCYDLSYRSQRESYMQRMIRRARRVRQHLGASENLLMPIREKPKGMHHRTFERLVGEEMAANQAASAVLDERSVRYEQLGVL